MFSVAVKTLVVLVPLLVSIAFITLAERKALGLIQVRRGPNLVGFVRSIVIAPARTGNKINSP